MGIDFSIEHQFTGLPGAWSGFGFFGNYTYTDSKRDVPRVWSESPVYDDNGFLIGREELEYVLSDVRFAEQPRSSGTAAITYNLRGFDAALSYTSQSRRLFSVQTHELNSFAEAVDSLDFRAEYNYETPGGSRYRIWLEGLDLLRSIEDALLGRTVGGTGGTPRYGDGGRVLGGRAFKVGFSATF